MWLIILELTLISFAITLDYHFTLLFFQVIGTIDIGFIILALCLKIPAKTLGIAGLVIIFTYKLLPLVPFAEGSITRAILSPLFGPDVIPITPGFSILIGYPPIPWLGIMLVGFAMGHWFQLPVEKRKGLFLKTGTGAIALFIVIRFINIYGDPVPWSSQKDSLLTFLSFLILPNILLLYCLILPL